MADRPSEDQRNSATFAALMMVLLISGGLVALVALVLPQVLWMVVIGFALALSVVLQYLVWGRWLLTKLRQEEAREESQIPKGNDPNE